jgi:hypothetical protein
MSHEPKFVARSTPKQPLSTDFVARQNKDDMPNVPTFDLTQLNLLQLSEQLKESLNKKSSWFIFLRNRENKKLQIQRDKIGNLVNLIESLRTSNQSLINYQAELFLSKAVLENLINGFHVKAQMEAELLAKKHLNELHALDHQIKLQNEELESKKIENLKQMAEVRHMEAKTSAELAKADLMKRAVANIDKFPPSLQTYIYRAVFNPGDKQEDDILLQDEVRDYLKVEKEATAELKRQEARKMKSQADLEEWDVKETMKR